ncbi:MAG TPA: hypothetical protein VE135_10080 [Pyrinomonadaceae bacterium]|nr:hypothetical protein [Pyrinomonadaceae bacterium]
MARSANVAPVGELKFRAYRLDESADGIFCLSVVLDEPHGVSLIWIGDDPLWAQHLREGELTASFPPEWLQQGAPISVSDTLRPYELTTHPERLTLPDSLKRQLESARSGERTKITSLRLVTRKVEGTSQRFVIVVITGSKPFGREAMNNTWVIQIGRKEFAAWPERNTLTCTMAEQEFAALEDGAPVRVNWGFDVLRGGGAGKSFAQLDKSKLDR